MADLESFASTAFLMADPARALVLTALLDGRALPAGELAGVAGITPQTASAHLARLVDGGLLSVERQGRHRYFRLAGPHVAQALEFLGAIRPLDPARRKALSPRARSLQFARCCYDHLAGQLGVQLASRLQQRNHLQVLDDRRFAVTPQGRQWFAALGIDVDALGSTRAGLARRCLDWTERRHHVAGPLGRALYTTMCNAGWLRRPDRTRAVEVTPMGWAALHRHLGIDRDGLA